MEKFDEWNEVKKQIQTSNRTIGIKPRDIYWINIGQNIGSEEFGKGKNFARPVIIIRKLTSDLFLGVPTTTTLRDNDYFHTFQYNNKSKGIVDSSAMILQVKTFSIKRLMNRVGMVNQKDFNFILEKTKKLISPT